MFGKYVLTAVATAISSAFVSANAASDGSIEVLEEVVVTAQKRAENAMTVPISITALSATTLAESGAKNVGELQGIVPGLFISSNTGYSGTPMAIRGTSGGGGSLGNEPVAVYIDGIYQIAQTIGVSDIADLRSIEVIRGPQGTLQGRNSTAGAILIRTADPEEKFGGSVRVSIADPAEYRAEAAITGGITDTLAARLSISAYDELGWASNTATGTRAGGANGSNLRGVFRWVPSEKLNVRLAMGYVQSDISVAVARWAATTLNPAPGPTQPLTVATPLIPLTAAQEDEVLERRRVSMNRIPRGKTTNPYAALEGSYDLGWAELVSITGAARLSIDGQQDSDALGRTDREGYNVNSVRNETFTEELRLQSPTEGRLSWIGGVYYSRIVGEQHIKLYNLGLTAVLPPPPAPSTIARNQYLGIDAHLEDMSSAVFGDATFKVIDQLTLTAGARYTKEEKEYTRVSANYNPATGAVFTPPGSFLFAPPQSKFNKTSYRVKVSYFPVPGTLLYASYSTGFKSGGYNVIVLGNTDSVFNPENMYSSEVGFKTSLFDRRAEITGAVYRNDYRDLQVTAGLAAGGVSTRNAARAKIDGAELEGRVLLTNKLSLTANAAYIKARYDDFPLPVGVDGIVTPGSNARGNTLVRAPKWQYFVQGNYDVGLWGDWVAQIQSSWRWRSKVYFFATNQTLAHLQSPGNGELGARINFRKSDSATGFALYGTNLTDNRYISNETSFFGTPVASFNKPRVVGVEISHRF